MGTPRTFASQSFSNSREALYRIGLFLTNETAGVTGPGWTLVQAGTSTERDVPSGGTFATLPGSNPWLSGSGPPSSGWFVLETLDDNNSKHCQIYFSITSSTDFALKVIPFQDFDTAGAATLSPTMPSSSFGEDANALEASAFSTTVNYSVVADEGMCAIIMDSGLDDGGGFFFYFGELDPIHTSVDTRCYVMRIRPEDIFWESTSGTGLEQWCRLSPADNKTILPDGGNLLWVDSTPNHQGLGTFRGDLLGDDMIWPVGVEFHRLPADNQGQEHDAGWLRHVFMVHKDLGHSGTIGFGSPDFYYRNNDVNASPVEPGICIRWDGVTVV